MGVAKERPAHASPLRTIGAVVGRGWRLVGTALSFTAFGVGGLVVGVAVLPVLMLVVRKRAPRARAARWVIAQLFSLFVGFMRWVGVLRYSIEGEPRAIDGGALIAANHPSLIDVIFLVKVFPWADCVVKAAHWSNPVMMGGVRSADYIPNHDTEFLLSECERRMREGRQVIMFPEGTRTVPDQPCKFQRGAALVAVRAGVPVIPVRIDVEPTTLTKAEPWYHIPRRQVLFRLRVLDPIPASDPESGTPRQRAIELTRQLERLLGRSAREPSIERR